MFTPRLINLAYLGFKDTFRQQINIAIGIYLSMNRNLVDEEKMMIAITKKPLTHYKTTNFRLFQTERVCRQQFQKNERKLSKQVENTVGKGEIACYEQFLLFPLCFQKACFPWAPKGGIVREWVNPLGLVKQGIV